MNRFVLHSRAKEYGESESVLNGHIRARIHAARALGKNRFLSSFFIPTARLEQSVPPGSPPRDDSLSHVCEALTLWGAAIAAPK